MPARRTRAKSKSRSRSKPERLLDRVRAIIADWPETDERLSHGMPTWWGGKKTFANWAAGHHGDERLALWIKADLDSQESLVEAQPEFFFVPPYVGPRGWIGVDVGGEVDWDVVEELLEAGYRAVAPKRAIAKLDADRGHA